MVRGGGGYLKLKGRVEPIWDILLYLLFCDISSFLLYSYQQSVDSCYAVEKPEGQEVLLLCRALHLLGDGQGLVQVGQHSDTQHIVDY